MAAVPRTDNSLLGRWWWTVDRITLGAIGVLIGVGYIMMLAASPSVAVRIGSFRDLFIIKQVFFLAVSGCVVVCVSLLTPRNIKRLAIAGCIIALVLTAATLVIGVDIKGARRWIALPGLAVQPSEFLKPCFAVVTAWLITEARRSPRFPGFPIAFVVFGMIALLLKSQPDVGMLAVITAVFLFQLYIGGMNLLLVGAGLGMMGGAGFMAFVLFQHVRLRVHAFLHPNAHDAYQVTTALEAFGNGGLFGRGPGEGRIKDVLPDAHADFVFAVAGEEYGMLVCAAILGVFAFIVLRGLLRLVKEQDAFVVLACAGLLAGFGLQAFVNMATTLALIPAKGMTLPFISYGGSSAVAVALGMGMLLSLTRNRNHGDAS
ncbi:MAG TPA: putative peptidoglycan glycosyltransferase FtsW [Acetobacteraceae bacterium]|jgi:cell division protein FtsW